MRLEDLETQYKLVRQLIEQNFPLNEIVPEYDGFTHNSANVYCVFHDNRHSPAAKLYWDEERDILVLHCFAEHKTFTSYDYVKKILCDDKMQYESPAEFLIKNMPEQELLESLKLAEMNFDELEESAFEKKLEYITNLYNELDDSQEFINRLYLA